MPTLLASLSMCDEHQLIDLIYQLISMSGGGFKG